MSWRDKTSSRLPARALELANDGFHVFPLVRGGKRPHAMLGEGGGYKHASADPEQVRAWWKRDPKANIGLHPGPSGLLVLDVDCKKGAPGFQSLQELEEELGSGIEAPVVETPSGGFHLYLKIPDGTGPFGNHSGRLGPGLDVRSSAGYVVAPGSIVDGKAYRWREGSGLDLGFPIMPRGLVDSLTPKPAAPADVKKARSWRPATGAEEARRAADMLHNLSVSRCDDYDDWLAVGAALHHSDPNGQGLALWDHWSARSAKYEPGACEKKWATFSAGPSSGLPATFGSLVEWARQDSGNPDLGKRLSLENEFARYRSTRTGGTANRPEGRTAARSTSGTSDALEAMDATEQDAGADGEEEDEPAGVVERWARSRPPDLASNEREPFPVDLLPPVLGDMARAMSTATCSPLDVSIGALLSVVSLAASRSLSIKIKDRWTDPAGLYIAFVGDPGSGKSPNLSLAKAPLVAWREQIMREASDDGHMIAARIAVADRRVRALQRELEKAIEDGEPAAGDKAHRDLRQACAKLDEIQKRRSSPRLYSSDITPEKLAVRMGENSGRFAVLDSEGTIFGVLAGRYGRGSSMELILSSWSGEDFSVDRKGDGRGDALVDLPKTRLAVGVAFQSSVMEEIAGNAQFAGRGLLDRFLYLFPKARREAGSITSDPVPDRVARRYERVIKALLAVEGEAGDGEVEMRLSAPALALLDEFERWITRQASDSGPLKALEGWAFKLPQNIARLAAIFEAVQAIDANKATLPREGQQVGPDAMRRAVGLAGYFIAHARQAFNTMALDRSLEDAKRLLPWLRDLGRKEIARGEAAQTFLAEFGDNIKRVDAALAYLADRGWLLPQDPKARDFASTTMFSVHPLALEGPSSERKAWEALVCAWWASHRDKPIKAVEAIALVDDKGEPILPLPGKTPAAQGKAFGRDRFPRWKNTIFKLGDGREVRIIRGTDSHGSSSRYSIQLVDNPSPSENSLGEPLGDLTGGALKPNSKLIDREEEGETPPVPPVKAEKRREGPSGSFIGASRGGNSPGSRFRGPLGEVGSKSNGNNVSKTSPSGSPSEKPLGEAGRSHPEPVLARLPDLDNWAPETIDDLDALLPELEPLRDRVLDEIERINPPDWKNPEPEDMAEAWGEAYHRWRLDGGAPSHG